MDLKYIVYNGGEGDYSVFNLVCYQFLFSNLVLLASFQTFFLMQTNKVIRLVSLFVFNDLPACNKKKSEVLPLATALIAQLPIYATNLIQFLIG